MAEMKSKEFVFKYREKCTVVRKQNTNARTTYVYLYIYKMYIRLVSVLFPPTPRLAPSSQSHCRRLFLSLAGANLVRTECAMFHQLPLIAAVLLMSGERGNHS